MYFTNLPALSFIVHSFNYPFKECVVFCVNGKPGIANRKLADAGTTGTDNIPEAASRSARRFVGCKIDNKNKQQLIDLHNERFILQLGWVLFVSAP